MVRESLEPGKSVSMVARQHGVNPNQLFHWRKLYQNGSLSAVSAGEEVVPASELSDALKQITELKRLLGKKTMENEILKEAVEVMKSRKWLARSPLFAQLWLPTRLGTLATLAGAPGKNRGQCQARLSRHAYPWLAAAVPADATASTAPTRWQSGRPQE